MPDRPNILFIHVDQMHFQAMSAYGNPHVKTPALDRMAADGCSFRMSYSAMPQCCPSRASWYTGRMSSEHGLPINGCKLLPDIPDLGTHLRKHGYDSVYAGKWHVPGRDEKKSFRLIHPSGRGEYADAGIARACMGYLANHDGKKPFFLNAGFMNPHDCCYTAGAGGGQGKFRFAKEIENELPPLPKNFRKDPKYARRTTGWKEIDWRYYIYIYYRWVEMVDAEIGRLYDALMSSRFKDNTVVVFAADHGDGLGFHGKVSKGYMEEEAWRVPTIVIRPGSITGGQDDEHLVTGVDIPATICDYAGAPMLPKMTIGRSLRPLAEGARAGKWREYVVGESFLGKGQVGVRDKQHKTILYCDGPVKVFDLKTDPLEMKDLSATPEGKAVVSKHKRYLLDYLNRIELCTRVDKKKPRSYEVYLDYYRSLKEGA
jgi:arylsulfatase A-like enzyme